MKALNMLLCSAILLSSAASAQQTYNTIEFIDINNIKAGHLVHGDMWYNPATQTGSCEYPKGSGKHVAALGSLWFGGYDEQSNLMVAAQTYRQTGSDYFPGPVDTSIHTVTAANQYAGSWARIWKVNKSTIDSFKRTSTHTLSNTPAAIIEWPAKGNIYAKGGQQVSLTIANDLAPFVDVNSDGKYNALDGDYPKIKGDQMLWSVFNDGMLPKGNTQTNNIGLEIRQSVYAYKRSSGLDNMVFYEYTIKNAGSHTLSSFRMGVNADVELGYGGDDYIGFDSSHRMGYVYNSKNPDGGGQASAYGATIPVAGISIMEFPNDNYPSLLPAGTFVPYVNGAVTNGNPANGIEYFRLLNGQNRTGQAMTNDQSAGAGSTAFGIGPAAKYAFPGDPTNNTQWSQCQSQVPATDWRFLLATESMAFQPGESKKIGMALIVSPDAGACGNLNLSGLRQLADSALITYYNPPPALGIHSLTGASKSLKVYPNPAKDQLYILSPDDVAATIRICDISGRQLITMDADRKGKTVIQTSQFPAGIYIVDYRSGQTTANNVFIKE